MYAAFSVSRRAMSISMRESAILSTLPPSRARGRPKAVRSTERLHINSSARSAMPTERMQW
ncbi:hypothetical protein D3C81_2324480 [compost metagenome]